MHLQLPTIIFLIFTAVLFFIVRQFLIKWGLGKGDGNAGDYGLGKFFFYIAMFVMWVMPSFIVWCWVDVWRKWW